MTQNAGIIKSILDSDLYKFTMQQAVLQKFPNKLVRYSFINRGGTKFPDGFDVALRDEIKLMESLSLLPEEESYLRNIDYLTPVYVDFLRGYRFNSSEVGIVLQKGKLTILIEGYWHRTILWEVPLMALISELYFKMTGEEIDAPKKREEKNLTKAKELIFNGAKFADFGTRRRYSFETQDEVIRHMKSVFDPSQNKCMVGTSNVYLAMKHNLRPIGTHAHEWFMFHAVEYGYTRANFRALDNWVDVYQGDLGIALSDTFTTENFFTIFDKKFAKLFDGVRHDSGDAFEFADKVVKHYKSLGIDPNTKSIVFSDGLNTELAIKLQKHCKTIGVMCSFGIGTNFTNDVGVKPLNMVIKLTEVKIGNMWIDTVKLSDNPIKHTGSTKEIDLCKRTLRIKDVETVD